MPTFTVVVIRWVITSQTIINTNISASRAPFVCLKKGGGVMLNVLLLVFEVSSPQAYVAQGRTGM